MRRSIVLTTALLALGAGGATSAQAATPVSGGVDIKLDQRATKALRAAKVRLVAVKPAVATRSVLTLPASEAEVGAGADITHTGVVQFRRGQRRVALTGARTTVIGRQTMTTARLGKRRVDLLRFGAAKPTIDAEAGSVRVTAPVSLTPAARKLLQRQLRVKRLRVNRLGTATLLIVKPSAAPTPPAGGGTTPAPAPGQPAVPTNGNISAGTLVWRARDSFVRYVNAGEGTSVSDGATAQPPEVRPGSDAPLVYAFGFPFAGGNTDGTTTTLGFTGKVTFSYKAHTINLSFVNPQVTLGPTSRLSVVTDGSTPGTSPGERLPLLDLNLPAATRTTNGSTETYTDIPATISAEGAKLFAGFYAAGSEFGSVTTSFTR